VKIILKRIGRTEGKVGGERTPEESGPGAKRFCQQRGELSRSKKKSNKEKNSVGSLRSARGAGSWGKRVLVGARYRQKKEDIGKSSFIGQQAGHYRGFEEVTKEEKQPSTLLQYLGYQVMANNCTRVLDCKG